MSTCKPAVCYNCGKYYCMAGCTFVTEYYLPAIANMVLRGEIVKIDYDNCKFCHQYTLYHFEDLV